MITPTELIKLGFKEDKILDDRYLLYNRGIQIELSGHIGLQNGNIPEGCYMLTTDDGHIQLSKPFSSIKEVIALIEAIS